MTIAGERYVDKRLILEQLIKDAGQIRLIIVPSQTELLRIILTGMRGR